MSTARAPNRNIRSPATKRDIVPMTSVGRQERPGRRPVRCSPGRGLRALRPVDPLRELGGAEVNQAAALDGPVVAGGER
jgi:hypothetical protein